MSAYVVHSRWGVRCVNLNFQSDKRPRKVTERNGNGRLESVYTGKARVGHREGGLAVAVPGDLGW